MKKLLLFIVFLCNNYFFCMHDLISRDTGQKRVVFLTGAAGFIGSNFLRYMFEKYPNYHFIVLDALTYAGNLENISQHIRESERFEFFFDGITNQDAVDYCIARADYVVHFAAESHVTRSIANPKVFIETDVLGTMVLLNSLRKHKNVKRFIHISTSEVYGTAEIEPMTEEHPLNPRSPYAAAKAGADRLVYSYYCTYDLPVVIIRPFNNYGPNQHLEKLVPRLITHAIKGLPLTVHGDGGAKRDWVHVLDTCDALDRVIHVKDFSAIKGQVINIGTGVATSVTDIANLIIEKGNFSNTTLVNQADRAGQVACHLSSTDKAFRLLGWRATHTLQSSMGDVIVWYKEHQNWWQRLEIMQHIAVPTSQNTIEKQ